MARRIFQKGYWSRFAGIIVIKVRLGGEYLGQAQARLKNLKLWDARAEQQRMEPFQAARTTAPAEPGVAIK